MLIKRGLDLPELLKRKSHFLFGPRGTGKTSLVHKSFGAEIPFIDLLSDDVYSRLLRRPSLLEELLPKGTSFAIVDEIQKIPTLLDEVQRLIETKRIKFLLTGSSARKLKRGGANLLGGRAWESNIFPFTSFELGESFDLLRYLNTGGLPPIYLSDYPEDELRNYIKLYLKEEIQAESLVKRLDHFARFLDTAALANSEELNFENIANDAGVPARTVASYFEILEDTLVGFQVLPFARTKKRKAIKRSKFYFFDVGVAGALAKRGQIQEASESYGKAFEHFIAQELRAYLSYNVLDLDLCYWRSTTQLEVDFIVGNQLAIEVKSSHNISKRHLAGLKALEEEGLVKKFIVVSNDPIPRVMEGVELFHWREFLGRLWSNEIVQRLKG